MNNQKGLVISLFDKTSNMVVPWAEEGYVCICVDIQHSIRRDKIIEYKSGGSISLVWGDIRSWTPPSNEKIKIVFAFPPCTDLAVSGARDFEKKRGYRLSDAIELFDAARMAGEWSGAPYMIENPVGRLSTGRGKPNYTFDPCDYGDPYTKKTCLWVGGGFILPEKRRVAPTEGSKMHRMAPSAERADLRAATPMGFARAVFSANSPQVLA